MNTLRRSMFANGNVVNIDPFILPRNPDVAGDSLLPHLIAQGSGLNQKNPSDYRMGGGLASQLTDQNFPPFQKMPEEGLIPDADVDALFEKINDVLLPNEIELSTGERIDFTKEIEAIKSGEAGGGYNIYPILKSPNIKLGTNVKAVLNDFAERDTPRFLKMLGQEKTDFGDMARLGIATIGELGKENLKQIVPFFTGQRAFDKYTKDIPFVKSEFMGGDPRGFKETSGRSAEEVDALVRNFNTNNFGDTITDALNNLDVDTSKFSGFFSKDPILEIDTVQRKKFEDAQEGTIQENLNNVSEEAGDGADPEIETTEVLVTEVEGGGQDDAPGDGDGDAKEEQEGVKPDITDGDAPKRNFAQFTRSPDFLRFVRNLGKGLVTSGQLGQGIALGAAGAAEEKYAEEVAASAAQADILKEMAKKGGLDVTDRTKILKVQQDMNQSVRDYNNAVAAQELAQSVLEFASGDKDLASFVSKIGATVNDVIGGFTGELDDPSKLSPTRRAQIALEILTNRNIKEILGESGRTISNIDRDIAKRVVGSLDNLKLDTVAAIKIKLYDNIGSIIEKRNESQRNIKAAVGALAPLGIGFDKEISQIFYGELGQKAISGTSMTSNPYANTNITFLDRSK